MCGTGSGCAVAKVIDNLAVHLQKDLQEMKGFSSERGGVVTLPSTVPLGYTPNTRRAF
jgi:hypothetical protein